MKKRVLSVGQCVPDHGSISRFLTTHFDVDITAVDNGRAALEALQRGPFDLVLVNRKLDVDYTDGIEVLRLIKKQNDIPQPPVMLVTNYPEHQQSAVAEGAVYGFGKDELRSPETAERLKPYLA